MNIMFILLSNFSSCSYRFVTAYHHDPSCCANVDDKVIQIEYPMGAEGNCYCMATDIKSVNRPTGICQLTLSGCGWATCIKACNPVKSSDNRSHVSPTSLHAFNLHIYGALAC